MRRVMGGDNLAPMLKPNEDPALQTARRRCLKCNHYFHSLSRFHRICRDCKECADRQRVAEALNEGMEKGLGR